MKRAARQLLSTLTALSAGAFLAACGGASRQAGVTRDALAIVLAPSPGATDLDRRIARTQERIRSAAEQAPLLEELGTLFVQKARVAHDDGFYTLAAACADAIESARPGDHGALLLRGHCLQSLHRFAAAEAIARRLVAERGTLHDFGLLGDVLVDRGAVGEAAEAYQRMLDLRPCLQSYTRGAHVRWLRGDLDGARKLLDLADGAGSDRDPESRAWTLARRAVLELEAGDLAAARRSADAALAVVPGYAQAELALGRVELASGALEPAITALRAAATASPLPEHQWALADALRAAGAEREAGVVEQELEAHGAASDPRSFALFLASRGRRLDEAHALIERELAERADVLTHDANAWVLFARGDFGTAQAAAERALAEGTRSARLAYHAGAIALANADRTTARRQLDAAQHGAQALLPSEREHLDRLRASL